MSLVETSEVCCCAALRAGEDARTMFAGWTYAKVEIVPVSCVITRPRTRRRHGRRLAVAVALDYSSRSKGTFSGNLGYRHALRAHFATEAASTKGATVAGKPKTISALVSQKAAVSAWDAAQVAQSASPAEADPRNTWPPNR